MTLLVRGAFAERSKDVEGCREAVHVLDRVQKKRWSKGRTREKGKQVCKDVVGSKDDDGERVGTRTTATPRNPLESWRPSVFRPWQISNRYFRSLL